MGPGPPGMGAPALAVSTLPSPLSWCPFPTLGCSGAANGRSLEQMGFHPPPQIQIVFHF